MKIKITRKIIIFGLGLAILFGIAFIYKEKSLLLFRENKVLASSKNNLPTDVQILYKTSALEVVPVFSRSTESSIVVELSVKNISSMGVVAYELKKSEKSKITSNGATMGWALKPNETDKITIQFADDEKREITLSAVLFEDNSGDGEAKSVVAMQKWRSGVKQQFEKALVFLNETKPSLSSQEIISSLETSLPSAQKENSKKPDFSVDFENGLQHGKDFLIKQIQNMQKQKGFDTLETQEKTNELQNLKGKIQMAIATIKEKK